MFQAHKVFRNGGISLFLLAWLPIWAEIANPGKPGAGVLLTLFFLSMGLWMFEHSLLLQANLPTVRKAVICGLNGIDWEFKFLATKERSLALKDAAERVLDVAIPRSMRPDDMPQFHWTPLREGRRTDGKIVGAKIMGEAYLLQD